MLLTQCACTLRSSPSRLRDHASLTSRSTVPPFSVTSIYSPLLVSRERSSRALAPMRTAAVRSSPPSPMVVTTIQWSVVLRFTRLLVGQPQQSHQHQRRHQRARRPVHQPQDRRIRRPLLLVAVSQSPIWPIARSISVLPPVLRLNGPITIP